MQPPYLQIQDFATAGCATAGQRSRMSQVANTCVGVDIPNAPGVASVILRCDPGSKKCAQATYTSKDCSGAPVNTSTAIIADGACHSVKLPSLPTTIYYSGQLVSNAQALSGFGRPYQATISKFVDHDSRHLFNASESCTGLAVDYTDQSLCFKGSNEGRKFVCSEDKKNVSSCSYSSSDCTGKPTTCFPVPYFNPGCHTSRFGKNVLERIIVC